VPDKIWLSLFVYRYQAFHFIILAILSVYFVYEVIRYAPKLKKTLTILLAIGVLWQAMLMGLLIHEIEPAITTDELAAAQYMNELDADFWLLNNIDGSSSFKSYEWILAYGDGDQNGVGQVVTEASTKHDYVMIQDETMLSEEEQQILSESEKVFEQGIVSIYKTK
jgi:hypothetical protein